MPPIRRLSIAFSALLVLIAVARICFTYSDTAQAFDEPCHVAAGIEFIDKKTYSLDPVHPPLSRIAIALPLYLAGERYPQLPPDDPKSSNYNVVGNHILYDSGHLQRNLALARIGVLPFFVLGAVIVFLWTLRIAGERSAVFAVFLYSTTPTILAFSSIAYTDIVAASTQLAALFAFSLWLERLGRSSTLWFALTLGLALLAKLTTVLFLPAAGLCMVLVWIIKTRGEQRELPRRALHFFGAAAIALLILWGGYRFSVKPIQEVTGLTPSSMPSFQHFPAFARPILKGAVLDNSRLPAPELLNGISHAWVLNNSGSPSYLFGRVKVGGWWYFYLCALAVKLPLPLLIAFAAAVVFLFKERSDFTRLLPLAALLGVLLVTLHVSYQVGLRHVLVCVPLVAIIAATGLKSWTENLSWRSAPSLVLLLLVGWQVGESLKAQGNFIAYFNELAGKDPGKVLSLGCDFDCGQDLYALARELQSRHISRVTLAVWTSADVDRSGLPPYDLPSGEEKGQGWIAVSSRAFRLGNFLHQSVPPHSFDWLQDYSPAAQVGKTIKLYYVDPRTTRSGN
jgi:Dolichyl-phosphate-mannose-protein mannosyltransferase